MTTDKPRRVQLQRVKGWRMPSNTVKVDRGTAFGNPFKADPGRGETAEQMVKLFVRWLKGDSEMVAKYPDLESRRHELLRRLPALRGKNLACWCRTGEPCHAEVLLVMANQEPTEGLYLVV